MAETGKPRYFRVRTTQEVLIAHTGSDEEVLTDARLMGASALNGLMGEHPQVHFVIEGAVVVELVENRILEE